MLDRIAVELERIGQQPTRSINDLDSLFTHLHGYKGAYEELNRQVGELHGYKKAYHDLNREVGDLRSRVPSVRTTEERKLGAGKPSIIVASLPKSATVFVGTSLAHTLGYDYGRSLVLDGFPKNMVFGAVARDMTYGGSITTSHLQCDEWNMNILKTLGLTKFVLLGRDPRAALFSWVNYYLDGEIFRRRDRNEEFVNLSNEAQLETHINGFYRHALTWMTEWAQFIEKDREIQVLELQYEEMVGSEEAYIKRILDFYGISGVPIVLAEKSKATNFKTGQAESWRKYATPAIVERINRMIPDILWNRYKWKP